MLTLVRSIAFNALFYLNTALYLIIALPTFFLPYRAIIGVAKIMRFTGSPVGVITAANLWGWLPAILWLVIGVSFIGWASDYSAIMLSVRNEGNSMSAIAHKLIAPRTRTILFVFIFFYLLLVAGASRRR